MRNNVELHWNRLGGAADRIAPFLPRPAVRWFLMLALAMSLLVCLTKPKFQGDAAEYTLMTVAIATHGTADITRSDVQLALRVFPEFTWHQDAITAHFDGAGQLPPGFLKGVDGKVHAIHSFGYSAVAAIPFKIAAMLGANPARCFLWVDGVALLLVAAAAYGYLGTFGKAIAAVAVLMMTVGFLYWNWGSPELYSTALSLSALMFMAKSRHVLAGCLIGLAGMQNPPLMALLFLGPVMALTDALIGGSASQLQQRIGDIRSNMRHDIRRSIRRDTAWRQMACGTLAGLCIGLSPIYFSYSFFGTWNIIAARATDRRLVTALRLVSYYIDFNQGMLVAIPGVGLILAWMVASKRRLIVLCIPVLMASLVLAISTLSTQNWNSGAAGIMRYVVWGAVPFLFSLFACSRHFHPLPKLMVVLFASVQALSVVHAKTYSHIEFSPLANWVLHHAPQYYNPEPEIFVDRSSKGEPMMDFDQAYVVRFGDQVKTLYYAGSLKSIAALCPHGLPTAPSTVRASHDGWTYLNGPVECGSVGWSTRTLDMAALSHQQGGNVLDGWSRFEFGSEREGGIWSDGKQSRLVLTVPPGKLDALTIRGLYSDGNWNTEVVVNGQPAGTWHLDRPNRISLAFLNQDDAERPKLLEVTLKHKAPKAPSAQDARELAFFMQAVALSSIAP